MPRWKRVEDTPKGRARYHHMYNSHRWRKARKAFLQENPLCVECESEGILTPAGVVDHIMPHRGNVDVFWDMENWQALCKRHHDLKTGRGK